MQPEKERLKTMEASSTALQPWYLTKPQLHWAALGRLFPAAQGGRKSLPTKALVSHLPVLG